MDDFKVGATSPYTPYGEGPHDTPGQKRRKRPNEPAPEQTDEDIVQITGQMADSEAIEDYYTPSRRDEEPE